jgi:hypothetical protein
MARFGSVSLGALNATFAVQTDLQRTYPGNASTGATVGFDISGVFVGTLAFEATIDDTRWFPVVAHQTGFSGIAGPITLSVAQPGPVLPGVWAVNAHGYSQVRLRMSAYTSGSATVAAAVTASQTELLVLREVMTTNELLAMLINGDPGPVDVNRDFRSDTGFGS